MGQHKLSGVSALEVAVKDFEKKFKDKTKNNWHDRTSFVCHAGKYTLIEVDGEQDAEVKVTSEHISLAQGKPYSSHSFKYFTYFLVCFVAITG